MDQPLTLPEVIFLLSCIILVVATLLTLEYIKSKRSPESNHYDFLGPKKAHYDSPTQAERTVAAWERNSAQIKEKHL